MHGPFEPHQVEEIVRALLIMDGVRLTLEEQETGRKLRIDGGGDEVRCREMIRSFLKSSGNPILVRPTRPPKPT